MSDHGSAGARVRTRKGGAEQERAPRGARNQLHAVRLTCLSSLLWLHAGALLAFNLRESVRLLLQKMERQGPADYELSASRQHTG